MWKSRVLCESSKRLWKSFVDFHGRAISIAVSRRPADSPVAMGKLDCASGRKTRNWPRKPSAIALEDSIGRVWCYSLATAPSRADSEAESLPPEKAVALNLACGHRSRLRTRDFLLSCNWLSLYQSLSLTYRKSE